MMRKIKPRRDANFKRQEILLAVVSMVLFVLIFSFVLLMPRITLKGKTVLTVNIGSSFKDPGYKATYLGKDVSSKVKVHKTINMKKKGTYQVVYTFQKNGLRSKVVRTVKVADIEAPIITLQGENKTFICPNSHYQEEGYQAHDNVDGDVTKQVKVEKKGSKIIYIVEDKAHNSARVERQLIEKDKEAPQLTLQGGEVTFVFLNEAFTEPGYQAEDRCDGDVTKAVKVTGTIDTSQIGEQKLRYTVTDQSDNKKEVERIIRVVQHGSPGTIYLTFDDGPRSGTTDVILDILKAEGVKATFFVTNHGPDELIKREAAEGHTVALHTASHNYGTVYASVASYFEDLQAVHDRVERLTGQDPRIIRFPGGSSNTISRKYTKGIMSMLTGEVLKRGYQYYDWNISSGDAAGLKDSQSIYQNVIKQLSKDRINMILMHDVKPYTRDALASIIQYGKANGYHFEAITLGTEMVKQKVNN